MCAVPRCPSVKLQSLLPRVSGSLVLGEKPGAQALLQELCSRQNPGKKCTGLNFAIEGGNLEL